MVSLAQKLKLPKTGENVPRDTSELFVAENGSKKHLIFKKNQKVLKMAKIGQNAKAIGFPKWSVWLKN